MLNVIGIKRIEILCRVTADLTLYGNVGNKHRAATRHCLKRGQAKPLVQGWEDKTYCLIIEAHKFVIAYFAQKANMLRGCAQFLLLAEHAVVFAYDIEFGTSQLLTGFYESCKVLSRINGRDTEDKGD